MMLLQVDLLLFILPGILVFFQVWPLLGYFGP